MLHIGADVVLIDVMEYVFFFFFQAEDGIRDYKVTGVQTCALPISPRPRAPCRGSGARGRCAAPRAAARGAAGARRAPGPAGSREWTSHCFPPSACGTPRPPAADSRGRAAPAGASAAA